ncbi:hypothetical protein [Micromonospora inyonensis]|uniref:Uncharacterized protein n=1 Tax=Micromonospora inyonensis TaxID=47866 RepID=A0A1C6RWJ2_9ACTN|nr:hypothetical protein [Micromonospora inyonensis]SCL21545.1 hypothetical protein GA0074694_3066 [Micromonospora inyonensis]SCL21761.1 hypothetical protein GA0074694_3138 [Micromonospora inyonensis]
MMKPLAWIGFALAVIGGAGLVGVGLASTVLVVAALGALIIIAIDIAKDRVPNQYAVIGAFVLPSLIVSINGTIPDWINARLGDLWGWANDTLGDWVGTTTVGLALAAVAVSFLVSTKTMQRAGR